MQGCAVLTGGVCIFLTVLITPEVMKSYSTKDIRNVVLLGSTKSGKTTLAEAMLYEGKVIDRRGTVESKNTVSDNTEMEPMNQRSR